MKSATSRQPAWVNICLATLIGSCLGLPEIAFGQRSEAAAGPQRPATPVSSPPLDHLLTRLILEKLPKKYVKDKDWGGQEKRWDGIEWKREGARLTTSRKWKLVNHGTWKKYSAELVDPNSLSVELKNFRKSATDKTAVDLFVSAHLKLEGRQSKWVKGVQLYSLSASGHAKLQTTVGLEFSVDLDTSNLPPDIVLNPVATAAHIEVEEFRIDRISKVGGEVTQQLSKQLRKELDQRIQEDEDRLVKKLNSQIDRNRDRLRISISQAVNSKWFGKARAALPPPVQSAIGSQRD